MSGRYGSLSPFSTIAALSRNRLYGRSIKLRLLSAPCTRANGETLAELVSRWGQLALSGSRSLPQRLFMKVSVKAMLDFVSQHSPLVFFKYAVNHGRIFCVNVADSFVYHYATLSESFKIFSVGWTEKQTRCANGRERHLMFHARDGRGIGAMPNDLDWSLGECAA